MIRPAKKYGQDVPAITLTFIFIPYLSPSKTKERNEETSDIRS